MRRRDPARQIRGSSPRTRGSASRRRPRAAPQRAGPTARRQGPGRELFEVIEVDGKVTGVQPPTTGDERCRRRVRGPSPDAPGVEVSRSSCRSTRLTEQPERGHRRRAEKVAAVHRHHRAQAEPMKLPPKTGHRLVGPALVAPALSPPAGGAGGRSQLLASARPTNRRPSGRGAEQNKLVRANDEAREIRSGSWNTGSSSIAGWSAKSGVRLGRSDQRDQGARKLARSSTPSAAAPGRLPRDHGRRRGGVPREPDEARPGAAARGGSVPLHRRSPQRAERAGRREGVHHRAHRGGGQGSRVRGLRAAASSTW